jgi:transposase-like protein
VDEADDSVDFLFSAGRNKIAARRFFKKSIAENGVPETVSIYKSGCNLTELHAMDGELESRHDPASQVPEKRARARSSDHLTPNGPTLRLKDFHCAGVILSGIQIMHTVRLACDDNGER